MQVGIGATSIAIRDVLDYDRGQNACRAACRLACVPMIFLPLPFVVTLFLLTLLLRTLSRDEAGERGSRLFQLLILAYALQSVLVGLRWGYAAREVLPFMSVLASIIAPLTWVFFRTLTEESAAIRGRDVWPHLLPAVVLVLMLALWRGPIGPFIILIYLGYGLGLLWLARRGPDALVSSRLDGAVRSHRAMQVTGFALIGSAVTDVLISMDIARNGGVHAGLIVSVADGLVLLALGMGVAVAGTDLAAADESAAPDEKSVSGDTRSEEVVNIAVMIDAAMRERGLFRDPELNLGKLSRRLGLPARQVSNAINRQFGISVSQYVNGYRVQAACELLAAGDEPISAVMFEVGFLTKSNFNREFLRVTGKSPSAWRNSRRR
ncbi:MAG: AraC family transcriptional regulator [Acidihalobacter sp.]